jgi:hypothetical protein
MHLKHFKLLAFGTFFIPQLSVAWAESGPEIAVGPVVSSPGIGIQASAPLIAQKLNITAGVTGFGFSFSVNADDGEAGSNYRAKVRLGAVPVYLSYYPGAGWFNLEGGILFNNNRVSYTSDYVADGRNYGDVTGSTHFNTVAPFIGIGFGQPFSGTRLSFTGNLGVAFAGGPGITLQPSHALVEEIPGVAADIQANQNELNNKAKWAEFFPVLSLGLDYRF